MDDFLKAGTGERLAAKAGRGGQPLTAAGCDKWVMIADKSNRTFRPQRYMVMKARSSNGFTAALTSLAPIIRAGWASRVRA